MYLNICEKLKNDYDIQIVSIYNCDKDNFNLFKNYNVMIINKYNIDNRFFKVFKYLKEKQVKKVFNAIFSGIVFFLYIPICRKKIKKIFKDEKRIIVTSSLPTNKNLSFFCLKSYLGSIISPAKL